MLSPPQQQLTTDLRSLIPLPMSITLPRRESSLSPVCIIPATSKRESSVYSSPGVCSPASPFLYLPVLSSILSHAETPLLLALRATSSYLKHHADVQLARHIEVRDGGTESIQLSSGGYPITPSVAQLSHTRVVDILGAIPPSALQNLAASLPSVEMVRLRRAHGLYPSSCPIPTRTLVLFDEPGMPDCDPGDTIHNLDKAVIHINRFDDTNSLWYHQILYRRASEVVLVFSNWEPPGKPSVSPSGRRSDLRAVALGLHLVNAIVEFISPGRTGAQAGTCVLIDIELVKPSWLGYANDVSVVRELWCEVAWQLERLWDHDHTQAFLGNLFFLTQDQYAECTRDVHLEMS